MHANKCYHCGDTCENLITAGEKTFCCEGCKQVYLILNENDLCNYYDLDRAAPGIKVKGKFNAARFAYLEDKSVIQSLVQYSSDSLTNITFFLPGIHCSSCIYLLENLHRIDPGIISSRSNFQRKELFVSFDPAKISLRKVVELLAFIGYEPDISLKDGTSQQTPKQQSGKYKIYRIGVAGFCFANIMMLSFPEYFSSGHLIHDGLKETFTWLNFGLSLPVVFYCATPIFISAWQGIQQKFLNIDAPIALAIIVTFCRSYYEIITGMGPGFLDSGSGIIFFMLVGRWFQNKTYESLSFDRDYLSYFPLGVTVISDGIEKNIPVTSLKKGDRIVIRNDEMIPADSILVSPAACLDYSFVSGEQTPVKAKQNDTIYAGGKQRGPAIELEVTKEVSQSYITQLWNNDTFNNTKNREHVFIHPWSRYFTLALFTIAAGAVIFWTFADAEKIIPVVTAVLIVACPCSLLLSATFTYGNMLRIFGRNKLYLKNSAVIESMASIDTVIFDKTGTITHAGESALSYEGDPLTRQQQATVAMVSRESTHPLSRIISERLAVTGSFPVDVLDFNEFPGHGVAARANGVDVRLGNARFAYEKIIDSEQQPEGSYVYLHMNGRNMGRFCVKNEYRNGVEEDIQKLDNAGYNLHILSGDNDLEMPTLQKMFGAEAKTNFRQTPEEKLSYVKQLQQEKSNVLMIGDGLNDAGALMQANVGFAVNDDTSRFSPACDAIIHGSQVAKLSRFLRYAKMGKWIVTGSFILSILYNIIGLSFAVSGTLSPIIAAILMPASSISIVVFVTLASSLVARRLGM